MSNRTFWDEPRRSVFRCAECDEKVTDPDEIEFTSACRRCKADLHTCRNCAWFDTSAENECRKEVAERIPKKRANNECTLFRPVMVVDLRGEAAAHSAEDARKAWDDLFE